MNRLKIDDLESHFKKFPDVPREVILKEDVLRLAHLLEAKGDAQ